MRFKRRFLLWSISVCVAGCSGVLAGSIAARTGTKQDGELFAIVNGSKIRERAVQTLYDGQMGQVVGEMTLWNVIAQNFGSKGLKVDPKEIKFPDYVHGEREWTAFGYRLYTQAYLRKEVLYAWPKQRLRKFYDLYKDDLAQYDVTVLQIVNSGDVSSVLQDIASEVDFESLAARYGVDESGATRQYRDWYSRAQLEEVFGRQACDKLRQLEPPASTKPVKIGSAYYIFHLDKVQQTFDEVRPILEQRIVDSRSEALAYELLKGVQVKVSGSLGTDPEVVEYDPSLLNPPGNPR